MAMDPNSQLWQNAIYIPEDDLYLKSSHQHDYVEHVFTKEPKRTIALDGGLEYCRRVGDLYDLDEEGRYVEWIVVSTDSFDVIAQKLLWGTRGKNGDEPLTYRPIKELAARPDGIAHMKAILANCLNIGPLHKRVVEYWLAHNEATREVIEG